MVDIHPKHTFVDENPYLVYNNENDATLDDVSFTLPTASADTLGGVKVGDGLSITEGGVLSATGGGGGSVLICSVTYDETLGTYTLDKTAGEIFTALEGGSNVFEHYAYSDDEYENALFQGYGVEGGKMVFLTDERTYYADTENDYPVG